MTSKVSKKKIFAKKKMDDSSLFVDLTGDDNSEDDMWTAPRRVRVSSFKVTKQRKSSLSLIKTNKNKNKSSHDVRNVTPEAVVEIPDTSSDDDDEEDEKFWSDDDDSFAVSFAHRKVARRQRPAAAAASDQAQEAASSNKKQRRTLFRPNVQTSTKDDEALARALQLLEDDDDDDDEPFIVEDADDSSSSTQDDAALARELQRKEDEHVRQLLQRQQNQAAMTTSSSEPIGKAWNLVEQVIQLCSQKQQYKIHNIQPVAKDDMIFTAVRLIEKQAEFASRTTSRGTRRLSTSVDLGFHYTNSTNLASIQQNGLMSKSERDRSGVRSDRFNGAASGDGVYMASDPVSSATYGDTGLIVARLPGDRTTATVARGSAWVVLKTSSQVLPLVRFPNQVMMHHHHQRQHHGRHDNPASFQEVLSQLQYDLGKIVDSVLNEGQTTYRCSLANGTSALPLMGGRGVGGPALPRGLNFGSSSSFRGHRPKPPPKPSTPWQTRMTADGATYYENIRTGVWQWEKPAGLV